MNTQLFLPISIISGIVLWTLVAKWYLFPILSKLPQNKALEPLVFIHAFRYIGLAFLIPGVTAEALDVRFSEPAAYGDFIAAILAVLALFALRNNWKHTTLLLWVFNIFGFIDLVNALTQGLRFTEDGTLGATYFIPAMIVPLLLVSHGMIFHQMVKTKLKEYT